MKTPNALSASELKKLVLEMDKLALRDYLSYQHISGGFSSAGLVEFTNQVIRVKVEFGIKNDVDNIVYTNYYWMDRNTFKVIF